MVKRIIFDLDNTLIMWKNSYTNALKETLEKFDIKEDVNYVNSLIDLYDDKFEYYSKELLLDFLNQNLKTKINMEFLNTFLEKFGYMSEANEKVKETVEYLSTKYELVVLTNWFTIPQKERLKNAGILKCFKEVIGGERYMKPNKLAFLNACGVFLPNECLVIGDDYNKDILGASNAGLNVIYFNYKSKPNSKFKEIKKIEELERIL